MIIITLALVVLAGCGIFLQTRYRNNLERFSVEFIGIIMTIVSGIAILPWSILCIDYISAGHKAQLINKEYGTNYTQEDVFYAGDVINTIREIKRTRIGLNININKEK